ncbi:MetJ regulator of methionine regulon [Pseudoalteromonas sp. NSLLW218]|uniref:MetJ regulator of methionine regulon n=1 Tax=Pseudoalteromonas sp. NSLLW218 TaxID=2792048 RepID=UPI001E2D3280|nr:MetJ regulator of methionine regulon [Pseudoalteromonas sp. NSLLW218]
MEKFKIAVLIAGSLFILFGYLRFITDDNGNVNLNNYRFTGGLPLVISGMVDGTRDLGRVDLYGLKFVQSRGDLIAARGL